jgi:phosphoserine phosphatase RsbU/P
MSGFAYSDARAAQLRKLTEMSRALTHTVSLDDVLRLAVERGVELLNGAKAVLMLTDDEDVLSVRASCGIDADRCEAFREPMQETIGSRLEGLLGNGLGDGEFTAVPLVVNSQVVGLLAVSHPMERSDDEREWLLSALADQAAIALEKTRLDETGAFRERLMGIVGHDLRTPLQVIIMASALMLRDDSLGERPRVLARRVANSAARMTDIIEQLLDFTRSRLGGGMPLTTQRIELTAVCRRVIEELELVHPNRSIVLEAGAPIQGEWDSDRLVQAVSNVVGNALQHGDVGTAVRVSLSADDGEATIAVRNEGDPIPASLIPRLFDPFRRGTRDSDAPSHGAGLGLGLFIAQQIIRAHHGTIAVSSSAEAGTIVAIRLPLQPSPTPGPAVT